MTQKMQQQADIAEATPDLEQRVADLEHMVNTLLRLVRTQSDGMAKLGEAIISLHQQNEQKAERIWTPGQR